MAFALHVTRSILGNMYALINTSCCFFLRVVESDSTALLHHLPLQAYQGSPSCATIHFKGFIASKLVQVLLDSSSSDSFIQPRLAHTLQLPMEPALDVKVMVGNGHYLHVEGVVCNLPLTISGHTIRFPTYVLPILGVEVVLRASWLATLGAHIAYYSSTSIKFYLDDAFVTL